MSSDSLFRLTYSVPAMAYASKTDKNQLVFSGRDDSRHLLSSLSTTSNKIRGNRGSQIVLSLTKRGHGEDALFCG